MKSIMFCTSFSRDVQSWESRYQRWLDYYRDVPIDVAKRILIDDGSPYIPPQDVIRSIAHDAPLSEVDDENIMIRFENNLGRQSIEAYPGWWRSFMHSIEVAKALGADKIIHIESDAFVLSQKLVDFINRTESGWHVLWAQRYRFPETAIQVICRDQFEVFEQFKDAHSTLEFTDIAERLLPFTSVDPRYKGDRYSEFKKNRWLLRSRKFEWIPFFKHPYFWEPIPKDADFVTQTIGRQSVTFRGKSK